MIGKLLKYSFFILNLSCFVFGIAVLGTGIWLNLDISSILNLAKLVTKAASIEIDSKAYNIIHDLSEGNVIKDFSIGLIVVGAFILIVSFLGCLGSIKGYRCLLGSYGLLLLVLFIGQIACAVTVMNIESSDSDLNVKLRSSLRRSIQNDYSNKEKNAITVLWNFAMAELHCCGAENYEDFKNATNFKGQIVPDACCKLKVRNETLEEQGIFLVSDSQCTSSPTLDNSYKDTGCFSVLIKWVRDHIGYIMGILIALAVFEAMSILSSVIIYRAIERNYQILPNQDEHDNPTLPENKNFPENMDQSTDYTPTEYV